MVEALNMALHQEMDSDNDVLVLGADVGVDGGVFRVTEGLIEKFGEQRVIDTPLAEGAIVGTAIGMAAYGLKPICETQFSGFSYYAFQQLESHAARLRWRSRGTYHVPMVLRTPYAAGIRALEHHSESRETYWAHTPGLKMVIPSGPRNARALLLSAIRDPDPVVFYEAKSIYRAFSEDVPDEEETMPLGKAQVQREGADLTLISYGAMMRPTLEAAEILAEDDGIQAEVIDLLSISPLDHETVAASVSKTGRAVVVNEAPRSFSAASEVVARLVEKAFWYLEAPIRRVSAPDVMVPLFAYEQAYLPDTKRVLRAARETLEA
ncbi:MAG: alpha-ketoacid dehydrogenase subunit beta [Chloroflexi bacterium]|nr:alpha-ketoacid dehydrogenase subunit beta [Chloroflexota bacterium]